MHSFSLFVMDERINTCTYKQGLCCEKRKLSSNNSEGYSARLIAKLCNFEADLECLISLSNKILLT